MDNLSKRDKKVILAILKDIDLHREIPSSVAKTIQQDVAKAVMEFCVPSIIGQTENLQNLKSNFCCCPPFQILCDDQYDQFMKQHRKIFHDTICVSRFLKSPEYQNIISKQAIETIQQFDKVKRIQRVNEMIGQIKLQVPLVSEENIKQLIMEECAGEINYNSQDPYKML